MGTPQLDVLAIRAARKVQPDPRAIDATGQDQDDYRQEAYMHALAVLSQVPAGVDAEHYLNRSMRNWAWRQWSTRSRQPYLCHLERQALAADRYEALDALMDVERRISTDDWLALIAWVITGDRQLRGRVYRVRKELRKCSH